MKNFLIYSKCSKICWVLFWQVFLYLNYFYTSRCCSCKRNICILVLKRCHFEANLAEEDFVLFLNVTLLQKSFGNGTSLAMLMIPSKFFYWHNLRQYQKTQGTPVGVNFINISHTNFSYEHHFGNFF
jgi:hypothetical protein